MAWTFELIAPLQPILHRVSCSNEMVPSAPKHYEMPQNMQWIGWICCKKFYATMWLQLLHLLQQFVPFSTEYRKATERSQMHPNTMEANKSLGPMGWIGCIRCEKFRHDFVAWTFALIAPVQPILHQVSCSNEMVANAPKHYETQQKLSLGSNGVD